MSHSLKATPYNFAEPMFVKVQKTSEFAYVSYKKNENDPLCSLYEIRDHDGIVLAQVNNDAIQSAEKKIKTNIKQMGAYMRLYFYTEDRQRLLELTFENNKNTLTVKHGYRTTDDTWHDLPAVVRPFTDDREHVQQKLDEAVNDPETFILNGNKVVTQPPFINKSSFCTLQL